jgi:hypothetical protein
VVFLRKFQMWNLKNKICFGTSCALPERSV